MASTRREYRAWGRLTPPATDVAELPRRPEDVWDLAEGARLLPFGNGRSYGDCCLNTSGRLVDCRAASRILAFDEERGVMRCEGGVLLSEILERALPAGWFLPVTPGTKLVTVGGAIANDVHGKNHHRAGTFGRHVLRLELLRSDGRTVYEPGDPSPWFSATVGGLGLTGIVLWADIQLKSVPGPLIHQETVRFGGLDDFFSLSEESDDHFEYTVSWIDCLAKGPKAGRGWFFRGNHMDDGRGDVRRRRSLRFLLEPPVALVNGLSLRAFNLLYYHRPVPAPGPVHYEPFFYPLDSILDWNRMYGPRGFYQFQCVVPRAVGREAMAEILRQIGRSGQGSFLAVLKMFGDVASPGLLSFPRPGPTLALDFPNRGAKTRGLLGRLESVVREAGGALYPAKDATMSPEAFVAAYPAWEALESLRDPAISSDFWRRVTGAAE